jgi:hypothetical protein
LGATMTIYADERWSERHRFAAFAMGAVGIVCLAIVSAMAIEQSRNDRSRQLALRASQLSAAKDYYRAIDLALKTATGETLGFSSDGGELYVTYSQTSRMWQS